MCVCAILRCRHVQIILLPTSPSPVQAIVGRALSASFSQPRSLSHQQWFHFFGAVKAHYTARSLPITLSLSRSLALDFGIAHIHTVLSFVCSCLFCHRLLLIALSLIKSTVWQLAENGKQIKGAWGGRERENGREKQNQHPPWHLWNYNLFKQPPHVQPPLHPAFPPSLISMPYTLLFILFPFPFPSFTPFPLVPSW